MRSVSHTLCCRATHHVHGGLRGGALRSAAGRRGEGSRSRGSAIYPVHIPTVPSPVGAFVSGGAEHRGVVWRAR